MKTVNLLPTGFLENALRQDARTGLSGTPKSLPSKWRYDAQGKALFEKIAQQPEYYLARAEHAILREAASAIARLTGAGTLIELGPGLLGKTKVLLDGLRSGGTLTSYVAVDVSEWAVTATGRALAADYPGLETLGVVADFEEHLGLPGYPASGPALVAFLTSAIGNMVPVQRAAFLARVRSRLAPRDAFLLGTDLVKAPRILTAAYDDAAGVTAAFDKNILAVVNARLGANFDLDAFEHVAVWVQEDEWVEMRLRSTDEQQVRLPGAGLTARFAAGEELQTEVSAKFRRDGIARELAAAGLEVRGWWTDPAGQFAVSLSVPV